MIESTAGTAPAGRPWGRGRERRQSLGSLLENLVGGLEEGTPPGALRTRLEEAIRRLVPVSALQFREAPPGSVRSIQADPVVLKIPTTLGGPFVMEITADGPLDDWQHQMLQMVATVAGLVLEIERARLAGVRASASWRAGVHPASALIGMSEPMQRLRQRIERVANTDFTVLIEGESGSGKELVARMIHEIGRRRKGPFVAINCAALVETLLEAELFGIEDRTATGVRGRRGKFEHADGGSLFLDEVSDLSLPAQAKLLRAIQDLAVERVGGQGSHRVDARIVVATNKNLAEQVAQGKFRADLYYRLNGVEIRVPPLRARREDVPELVAYFLERHRAVRRLRLSRAAGDALQAYHWPGNVRELERVIERAVALTDSDEIGLQDLPSEVRREYSEYLGPSIERSDSIRLWGSRYARLVLERHGNNKRQACRALGISYHTLQAYLRYRAPSARHGPSGIAGPDDDLERDA
jgi:transcriptional regulator with PAS, ATPase and Fis domain